MLTNLLALSFAPVESYRVRSIIKSSKTSVVSQWMYEQEQDLICQVQIILLTWLKAEIHNTTFALI